MEDGKECLCSGGKTADPPQPPLPPAPSTHTPSEPSRLRWVVLVLTLGPEWGHGAAWSGPAG